VVENEDVIEGKIINNLKKTKKSSQKEKAMANQNSEI